MLLGDDLGGSYPAAREKVPEPAKPFVLPPQSESMRRVYAYLLQKRCIDREILNAFVHKKLIYESCERSRDGTKEYHNAVFVGFDEHGVPRHGHKRGLYTMGQGYRGNIEGSDPKHSFHYLGGDDTLYVFEAPIDLLSYLSLSRRGGRRITMWPAAGHPPSPCWRCCGSSPSSGKCTSVWTMTLPVMPPVSAWRSCWRSVVSPQSGSYRSKRTGTTI